jgi:diguanylate cyclase (GGDEF)-like protein
MARAGRLLFFAAFVVVVGGAAWTQFVVQRSHADDTAARASALSAVADSVVLAENATRDATLAHDGAAQERADLAFTRVTQSETTARAAAPTGALHRMMLGQVAVVAEWRSAAEQAVRSATTNGDADPAGAVARGVLVTQIGADGDAVLRALDRDGRDARDAQSRDGLIAIVVCCLFFALLNWVLFVRTERRTTRARDRQVAFSEHLQSARTEDEARSMLATQLEAVTPAGTIAIVTGAGDRSTAGRVITSGGERVGTVILRTARDLRPDAEHLVHDSILRAAPVLSTLRALALAQARAATDPLTGLGNRRLFEDAVHRLVAQSRRTGSRFAVAVADVDHFKPVNDTYGHHAGDTLLVAIADALTSATREYDIVGRLGGDEFVVLLADVDVRDALTVIERCRSTIGAVRVGEPPVGTTASFGIAMWDPAAPVDPASLLRSADDAVYDAKRRGGNRVVVAAPSDAQASALRA